MAIQDHVGNARSWFPIPTEDHRLKLSRWILLEANRYAVTGALLTVTFVAIMANGSLWTFETQRLLTETQAVQTVLNTLLSGIILLVSIVVSINSVVLSYDITAVTNQQERIEGTMAFRQELDQLAGTDESPTDPQSFLRVGAKSIKDRARALEDISQEDGNEFTQDIQDHVEMIVETVDDLEEKLRQAGGGEYAMLWLGLETDYGPLINQSRQLTSIHEDQLSGDAEDRFMDLERSLEVFATGREYFKTLYYSREIADLSRTLLIISLPAIIATASTILAINANLLPDVRLFGLPPLLTFIAVAFTIALSPYIVLTAYMLRVATVARLTASSGPFSLKS
jgi:hypothetical protein